MDTNWQLIATLAIVAAAAGYLAWRGYLLIRKTGGSCGTACGGCGNSRSDDQAAVVELSESFNDQR